MKDRLQLKPGEIVNGRYRIEEKLGKGAMGVVYRALHLSLKKSVALKVMRPAYSNDEEYRARFIREAKVCALLSHRNSVQIYDFGEYENLLFLTMEFLKGISLRTLLDQQEILTQPSRIFSIMEQLTHVISASHEISLVHRDLKPENIILEPDQEKERVVVVDFGLAFSNQTAGLGRMTASNVIWGTPQYLSPEQARGMEVGPPSDIYAIGCIFFEMLTGAPPYANKKAIDLIASHVYAPIPSVNSVLPSLAKTFDQLLQNMLQKQPEKRPDIFKVKECLSEIIDSLQEKTSENTRENKFLKKSRTQHTKPILAKDAADQNTFAKKSASVVQLLILGELLDESCNIALAANGIRSFYPVEITEAPRKNSIIFAPDATPETIKTLAKLNIPILTSAEANDLSRIAHMLRAGASEIVVLPIEPQELLRKVFRSLKKYQRTQHAK